MRRAVILATLTCILFAVAGVTVAGENTFTSSSPDGDQTESTGPWRTVPQATALEATVPETTVPDDVEKPVEGTLEATVGVHEEQKEPGKGETGPGSYGGIQNDNSIEEPGEPTGKPDKPEHAQGGKSRPATGRPHDAGEKGFDGNPGKVTLCHKNRVTISVGAPAWPAHQRHGDSLGTC